MMGFTIRDIIGHDLVLPELRCTTGKRAYPSKREAQRVLTHENTRTPGAMRVFRCGYCAHYHLGHRRGAHE